MKDISGSYADIFANPNHWAEHRVTIGGSVFGMESIVSLKTPGQLFDSSGPGIGSAVSLSFFAGRPNHSDCVEVQG